MKKITLSILMLGITLMVVGGVSAATLDLCQKNTTTWQCDGDTIEIEYTALGNEFTYELASGSFLTMARVFEKPPKLVP